jgi:phospholipid/cholesterol/gamma-HCH transport system substrate-binding protein/paraquat-inducible protein B
MSMPEKQRYRRLGLFVVLSLTILAGLLFVLGGRSLFAPTLVFETYFDKSVSGLGVGAQVSFRGVPLGQVSEIVMSTVAYENGVPFEQRAAFIVVRAKLSATSAQAEQWQAELPEYVRRGLRAQTQLAGITGQQYLALDYFDPEKYPEPTVAWTPDYPVVPSAPSMTGEIIGSAQQFLASLNEADIGSLGQNLDRLVLTLDDKIGRVPVDELSADADSLIKEARTLVEHLDEVITQAPIDEAVGDIASASARLNALLALPALGQTLDNTAALTNRLRTLAAREELDTMIASLARAVQRIDALVGDNQYDVRVVVEDLRATADNLRTLSETAKRYPAGVLFGAPPKKADFPWNRTK